MSETYDVAIVGAGPTGLTLANLLGQAGVGVILIERNEGTVREPRAVSIDDESLRTMQAAGLADAVIANVALDYGSRYYTPQGVCFARVEPKTREYGFPRRNAFTQPKLEATLREGLARFPSVRTLFSCECEAFQDEGDGVRLRVVGVGSEQQTVEAKFLVGCDGARSPIRKAIGATLTGSTYEEAWLIVDLAATKERLRQTRVVCDPARPLITLPGPDGIRRYEFMLRPGEDERRAMEPEFVRALLAASGPDADMPVVRRQVYTFHARVADRWRKGRVLLAGDAAHLSPPFAGQGMNSGIRDAHNLSWKLIETVHGRATAGLLDTYQQERMPHARALIELAIRMGRVMMPSSPMQARLVQSAFRLMRFSPRLRSYFAEMKYKPKPFYAAGFVVPGGAGLAGRMFPQPLVERADRSRAWLDTLLGDRFALVTYGRDAQRALDEASRLDFGVVWSARLAILPQDVNPDRSGPSLPTAVRDVEGVLASALPRVETVVLAVRPDRYVCAAAGWSDLGRMAQQMRELAGSFGSGPADAPPRRSTSACFAN